MVKLQYSIEAVKDLKSIHDYIGRDSTLYARRFIQLLRERIGLLKQHPQSGRPFYKERYNNLRQVNFEAYRIIYHLKTE